MKNNKELLVEARREASKSTCLSKHVGALVVIGDKIVARGFNETAQGVKCGLGGCWRCQLRAEGLIKSGEGRSACLCTHAEINAIDNLKKQEPLIDKEKTQILVTIPPCILCARAIVDAGVKSVCFPTPDHEGAGILYLREQGISVICL